MHPEGESDAGTEGGGALAQAPGRQSGRGSDPGDHAPGDLARDPRPDLQADHELWERVLAAAYRSASSRPPVAEANATSAVPSEPPAPSAPPELSEPSAPSEPAELLGLLHGLRCLGARLRLRHTSRGLSLFLDISPLAFSGEPGPPPATSPDSPDPFLFRFDRDALRLLWLQPHRTAIQALFATVLREQGPTASTASAPGTSSGQPALP